ncbi:MAG: nitric oxide synthase [Deltaproteobacteria bacterium]|nr:nitric oxide synthase [Deltaproteobacteria bacterium]
MPKALIVNPSEGGEIGVIGGLIADGLRQSGIEVDCIDAGDIKDKGDFLGYNALIFGSDTIFGEISEEIKTALSIAEHADLEGKVGGAFGMPGCTQETAQRIYDKMKNVLKMEMVNAPLCLETISSGSAMRIGEEYGQEIAKKIGI